MGRREQQERKVAFQIVEGGKEERREGGEEGGKRGRDYELP
jgi:hypothetical protein